MMTTDDNGRTFVEGTTGHKDYLAIARKGDIVLSVKPNYIGDSESTSGVPGLTYFGARLRSAHTPKDWGPAFGKHETNDLWGGVEWDKVDAFRASAQVGTFLKGTIKDNAELLLEAFTNGDATKKFAKFLIQQAGEDVSLLVTEESLAQWLEEKYAPSLRSIIKVAKAQAELRANIEQNVGVFASQTTLLKKFYAGVTAEAVPNSVAHKIKPNKSIHDPSDYADKETDTETDDD